MKSTRKEVASKERTRDMGEVEKRSKRALGLEVEGESVGEE